MSERNTPSSPIKKVGIFVSILLLITVTVFLMTRGPEEDSKTVVRSTPTPAAVVQKESSGMDTAYFAKRFSDLSDLAQARFDERVQMHSSHNFNQGMEDADVFLEDTYTFDGVEWRVMADDKGPGCITRIWLSNNFDGRLRFYFDQEQEPRLDVTVSELMEGSYKQAAPFLVFSATESNTGQCFYIPMPFKKHCTVMASAKNSGLKYQINVRKFSNDADVITFNPTFDERTKKALTEANAFLAMKGFGHFLRSELKKKTFTLPPKGPDGRTSKVMILDLPGPAAIDYFQMKIESLTPEIMRNLRLQVYWDRLTEPSIDCSIADLFCSIDLNTDWNSLPLGYLKENNLLFSQFYMPYLEKAQFFIENNNNVPVELSFDYHIDLTDLPSDPLHLFVRTNYQSFYIGWLHKFLEFQGVGNFVGMNLSVSAEGMNPRYFYMEGDEYFYVNGEKFPAWNGTGMDHYFNCDDKISKVNYFWMPTHGCIAKADTPGGASNCFRFHLLDSIPFQTSLMFVQEIGCPIQYMNTNTEQAFKADYKWTCFWYGRETKEKVPRQEELLYYVVSQNENDVPTELSPIMQNAKLNIKLPLGTYWIHYAPVWDLSQVRHRQQEVK